MKTLLHNLRRLLQKYSHAWIFLYGLIYMPWFTWLETHVTTNYNVIYSPLDDYIPFIEVFIIPYLLWFFYVASTCLYFFFKDKVSFYKFTALSIVGMTFFLIISTVWPNGLQLRPSVLLRENIFTDLVRMLWIADTPTNVFPSLHVYNSVACYIAISHDDVLSRNHFIKYGSLVLTISIVLSTVFLKQHSILDLVAALLLIYVAYLPIYAADKDRSGEFIQQII